MLYDEIIASWHEKKIRTAADIALEMNGNGASFIYHSARIENDNITYHDTREIFDHGGVTSYTGDVRSLFEIQNSVAAYYRMLDAFEKREPMSEALICEFQGLLTQGTYDTLRYQRGEHPGAYKQHDYVTGAISHLPHIIASSLVNFVKDNDTEAELMKNLAAGGFKDITRIASSSPTMWQHICLANQENISRILGRYIKSLQHFKELIDNADEQSLYRNFDSSKNYRNAIPSASKGPIKKAYAVYCDIIDEAGGIAAIATILASNGLNIKNIGIVHNREFEEGVLRIEFYDEASSKRAAELLQKFRYIVYER